MGTDLTPVNAARVSFKKTSTALSRRDKKLLKYLAQEGHFTPFTHTAITFCIRMPIFTARQFFKHTIGFSYNEVSRRYVDNAPDFYNTDVWRARPPKNKKQGSGGPVAPELQKWATAVEEHVHTTLAHYYEEMVVKGICPEQARKLLPQDMMTEFWVTGNVESFARLYALRTDPHAQYEIKLYAEVIGGYLVDLFPYSWAAKQGLLDEDGEIILEEVEERLAA